MSGIFGLLHINTNTQSTKSLDLYPMLKWNRLYGSDCHEKNVSGTYDSYPNETVLSETHENLEYTFGCCLFFLSADNRQKSPIIQESDTLAVIDAVIYNRKELLTKCSLPNNTCDAELLLTYMNKYGPGALKNVNGDFAGAIFDKKSQKLLLFRDHLGIRPLFYYHDDQYLAFSSDIRGLLSMPCIDTELDEKWLYQKVSGFDSETLESTPYNRIKCVTPAAYIEISFDQEMPLLNAHKYWKLGQHKYRYKTEQEYTDELERLIKDSVKIRLEATTEGICSELSGGLDSSVISILINRLGKECTYCSWSLDPSEYGYVENDERIAIKDICDQENIHCHYMSEAYEKSDILASTMQKAGLNVPSGNISLDFRLLLPESSNSYKILSTAAFASAQGAKVVFTGHGGDEGVSHRCNAYELFYHHEYYHYLKYIWSVTRPGKRIFRVLKKAYKNITENIIDSRKPYVEWSASPELLKKDFADKFIRRKERSLTFAYDPISYIEHAGSRNRLDNLAVFGAHAGVRYMVPYLDYRVIDYAVSIPRYLYLKGTVNRYIFRQAFKDIMPTSLYKLQVKGETSTSQLTPAPDWFAEYDKRKKEIIDNLDRDYFSQYIHFEKVDKLRDSGKPSKEEYPVQFRQQKALLSCGQAYNLIRKSKEYVS